LQTFVATAGAPSGVEGFLTSTARSATRYIHGLAVVDGARRRGIGRMLLRACIAGARAAGLRSVVLHVGVANRPAVLLYDAEGFEVNRVLRGFYRPGLYASRDAYELVLPLG
jgi:ribosomal protein S18 acetylase RimI-like enzyme